MLDTQARERLKSIFDGYLSLPGETYEFISRTIAMDCSLKEAHALLQENPRFQADELYRAWLPTLNEGYRNLFAVFLRPYRMVMFPFGDTPAFSPPVSGKPLSSFGANTSIYGMWSEAGTRFLKGFFDATGEARSEPGGGAIDKAENPIKDVLDATPPNLAGWMDEQSKGYFESAKQVFGLLGDNQFLFPKSVIVHLQKVCDSYPRVYSLSQKYETMLWGCCEKGLKRLANQVTGQKQPTEFKAFFDTYVSLMAEEYDNLLHSPDFLEVQNSFTEAISDLIVSLRKTIEARLELFPFLPLVTTSEMVALEKSVHSQKRQMDVLERRIAELEDRLGIAVEGESPIR